MNWQTDVPANGIATFSSEMFPCTHQYLLKCQETHHPPGEGLAAHLSEELRRLGADDVGLIEGDFSWELHPRPSSQRTCIEVCVVFRKEDKEPIWAVVTSAKCGLIDRLFHGRNTASKQQIIEMVRTILADDAQHGRVTNLKWISAHEFRCIYGTNSSGAG